MLNEKIVCITGASGAVGSALLSYLFSLKTYRIRVLVRPNAFSTMPEHQHLTTFKGDLLEPDIHDNFIVPGATVINLAYLQRDSIKKNLKAIDNLATACIEKKIKRFIHCSTAVISGRVKGPVIDESSPCNPTNSYETTKLAVEKRLMEKYGSIFEIVTLRPTAIFGPYCKNLIKLTDDLLHGQRMINYFKSCIFNQRKMNLICVDNLTAAILFLIESNKKFHREIFIISDDDEPGNNYRFVEKFLLSYFHLPDYPLPRLPLPHILTGILLQLKRRSQINPLQTFSCRKIINIGFQKPVPFEEGLRRFCRWYGETRLAFFKSS